MIRGLRRKAMLRAVELLSYLAQGAPTHRPAGLSGGEQQRVAIARAVANAPRLPMTDRQSRPAHLEHVFNAMTQLVRASGLAVVIATHNMDIAARMDRG